MRQATLPYRGRSPHARQASYQGALQAADKAPTQTERLYAFLLVQGQHGATDEDCARALAMPRHLVPARRAPLIEGGRVVDSGQTRRSQAGVQVVVWRVAGA